MTFKLTKLLKIANLVAKWVQCRQLSIECSGYIVPWTYNDKYLSFVIKSIFQRPEEDKIELVEAYQANLVGYAGYASPFFRSSHWRRI